MIEIYKDIEGYEGYYQVSNLGNVRSLTHLRSSKGNSQQITTGRVLKQDTSDKRGYRCVRLSKEGKSKKCFVHILVAQAFLENPNNLPQVNHKDENKSNNQVSNLEYCTARYNSNYGTRTQRVAEKQRNNYRSKTTYQYTLDGELVAIYPSTKEITRKLGIDRGFISNVCRGKQKTAYGYIWSYKPLNS